jgi:hypothetical protein
MVCSIAVMVVGSSLLDLRPSTGSGPSRVCECRTAHLPHLSPETVILAAICSDRTGSVVDHAEPLHDDTPTSFMPITCPSAWTSPTKPPKNMASLGASPVENSAGAPRCHRTEATPAGQLWRGRSEELTHQSHMTLRATGEVNSHNMRFQAMPAMLHPHYIDCTCPGPT